MQPQQKSDQYQPKVRHFHPQSIVWVVNPFDHVVEWKVADENDDQAIFTIQAHERAELPGGMIATLGVKTIVDEMIQDSKEDQLSLHNVQTRTKYEEKVILRIKEAPTAVTESGEGKRIDLSTGKKEEKKEETVKKEEKPFKEVPENPEYTKDKKESVVEKKGQTTKGK